MKKSFIVPLIVFVVLSGGIFYLFTTFQFNLFRAKVERFDNFTLKKTFAEHDYSLGDVIYGGDKLSAGGWGLAVGIVIGIPLVFALLVRYRIKRKERKKLAALQNETQA